MTKTTTKKSPRNWQNNYNKTLFLKKNTDSQNRVNVIPLKKEKTQTIKGN